jgi:triacylglycerol lipase
LIELTPQQAALIAQNVYNVLPVVQDMKHVDLGIDDLFSVENDSRFQGRSGCIIFNSQTGFGYVAKGLFQHANEALVAIRGTALSVDWITDCDAGIDVGPSGYPVHSGFSKSYKSFRMALDAELNRLKPLAVHVVGHSLGGALGLAATCGITLLDRLAQLLYSGVLISVKIAEQVKGLLVAIMKFLGRTLDAATQISVAFNSWVLQMLFRVLATAALKAVHAIHAAH